MIISAKDVSEEKTKRSSKADNVFSCSGPLSTVGWRYYAFR